MILTKQKKLFLFDFDGTLVHTAKDVQAAINYMRKQYNLRAVTLDEAQKMIGRGQAYTISQAIKDGNNIDSEEADKFYSDYYAEHSCVYSEVYPNVQETLAFLKENGKKVMVVSNKYTFFVEKILKTLGILEYFDGICGPNLTKVKKPDPENVYYALRQMNNEITLDETVMIGDSIQDIRTGKNAGITTVCVAGGYSDFEELVQATPDAILNSINELKNLSL